MGRHRKVIDQEPEIETTVRWKIVLNEILAIY